jgi:DNA mismatch repair protein MutL
MPRIRVLNERLINKIAAGEVVERPASALKEIIENSLDAGAGMVRVELESGGKRLLRVVDDGHGMSPDDILLAVERHATSKITEMEDLEAVGTLGFRGEAIPSLAAVSKMQIKSRSAENPDGRQLIIEGGVIRNVTPIAMAVGTTIEVRGLFYNVPARRKFLKTTQTEFAHCQNVITHYALAFPEKNFSLKHNGLEVMNAPPVESTRDRIATLLGTSTLEQLLEFQAEDGPYSLIGFTSSPGLSRSDTSMLNFFVNRRVIKDKLMIHAVRAAYEDLLPKGRTPVVYLMLNMPPRDVDVNVHPSKTEVRFKDSSRIHSLIVNTLKDALAQFKPTTPFSGSRGVRSSEQGARREEASGQPLQESEQEHRSHRFTFDSKEFSRDISRLQTGREGAGKETESLSGKEAASPSPAPVLKSETTYASDTVKPSAMPKVLRFGEIHPEDVVPLGQVRNSYIVAKHPEALLIIDQHAAHERILFEQLQRFAMDRPVAQRLLHPVVVDLTPARAALVEEHTDELAILGFDIDSFGPASVALRAMPESLSIEHAEEIVELMASDLERMGKLGHREKLIKEMIVSASCHGAIKINQPLNTEKMRWLIDQLFACNMPMRCPHGRPVVLTFDDNELKQRFGRS